MSSQFDKLAALFCLLATGQLSAGKLFEWKDHSGATHFSDRAPVGLPFAEKAVRPASRSLSTESEAGIRKAERTLLEKAQRRNSDIKHAQQAEAQQIEQRKLRCRQARERYHEAIHRPGSAGSSDFRTHLRNMNETCN